MIRYQQLFITGISKSVDENHSYFWRLCKDFERYNGCDDDLKGGNE